MAEEEVRVKSTPVFKLKDQKGRSWQGIHLRKQFGFIPDVIIVEKMPGQNNRIVVRAVLTEEEIKKEDLRLKNDEKERNEVAELIKTVEKKKG
jgi:hypothetical protein